MSHFNKQESSRTSFGETQEETENCPACVEGIVLHFKTKLGNFATCSACDWRSDEVG